MFSGLYFPRYSVALSVIIAVSRISYCCYLSDQGFVSNFRKVGSIGNGFVLVAGFVLSFISALKMSCVIE